MVIWLLQIENFPKNFKFELEFRGEAHAGHKHSSSSPVVGHSRVCTLERGPGLSQFEVSPGTLLSRHFVLGRTSRAFF